MARKKSGWAIFGIVCATIVVLAGLFFLGVYIADVCNPDMTYVEILQEIFGIAKETAEETPTEEVETTGKIFLSLMA